MLYHTGFCAPDAPTALLTMPSFQRTLQGSTHYADWSAGGWHPKTFTAADLTPQLVTLMRSGVPGKVARLAALQQESTAQLPATASSIRNKDLQQSRAAAMAMDAAAAECNAAQAVLTATKLIFKPLIAGQAHLQAGGEDGAAVLQQQLQQNDVRLAHGATGEPQAAAGGGFIGGSQAASGLNLNASAQETSTNWLLAAGYMPLGKRCPLFARKFPSEIEHEVLAMVLSCRGLGLGSWCQT